MSYSNNTLLCIKGFSCFEPGERYYCFADEEDHFWIFAPWLEGRLGVNQVKVSGEYRGNFELSY